jgi:hypothetical protein
MLQVAPVTMVPVARTLNGRAWFHNPAAAIDPWGAMEVPGTDSGTTPPPRVRPTADENGLDSKETAVSVVPCALVLGAMLFWFGPEFLRVPSCPLW